MINVKSLNVFVIMNGDNGYYSNRTGGSAFREDPVEFTLFRNYTNADRKIRGMMKMYRRNIQHAKDKGLEQRYIDHDEAALIEWSNAEVVKVVD